ncbi:MAG TPA: GTPase ObgE [Candidatus Paceibacterota bacterium]|nr:GTPase ObgE [Candidatus Paceibacterota bacterium]
MPFVDELKIHIKAGKGGDGVVRWLHEKGKEFMGPSGGNGGRGGDVYARAVSDLNILSHYRNKKEFKAENGESGMKKSMHGKDGADLIINVPIGSVLTNLQTEKKISLDEKEATALLLKGGRGGLGNEHFKASTNIRPKEFTLGKDGEEADFFIEVELVAAAGLIGLPNAGKSSLLNALTGAEARVGQYQFTTLEPNLGAFYEFILADIPGLISGASEGKGLGQKFLRHVKRTKILFHCISLEGDILESYSIIRKELEKFDPEMAKKPEVIILTKSDVVTPEIIEQAKKMLSAKNSRIFTVSGYDEQSIENLKKEILKILRK